MNALALAIGFAQGEQDKPGAGAVERDRRAVDTQIKSNRPHGYVVGDWSIETAARRSTIR